MQAQGGILAHSLRVTDRVLRKGTLIDTTHFALLHAVGYEEVTTRARITANGGTMLSPRETPHEIPSLVAAINALLGQGADIILISGASAVTDRLDVVPQAIVEAGGRITRFGMPVAPGI